ncbi:MAG: hypothetical protein R3E31_19970 [Chloroflexota bacterium]
MVERCELALQEVTASVELIDLRTIIPGTKRRCWPPCANEQNARSCMRTSAGGFMRKSPPPLPMKPSSTWMVLSLRLTGQLSAFQHRSHGRVVPTVVQIQTKSGRITGVLTGSFTPAFNMPMTI